MRTPRTKTGVNNENNASKCPHKPRTKPLMLICRPGVPSLLPPPSAAGQWPGSKCKLSNRKGIPQVYCSLHGDALGLGEKESLGSAVLPPLHPSCCHLCTPQSHQLHHPPQTAPQHGLLVPVVLDKCSVLALGSCVSLAESFNWDPQTSQKILDAPLQFPEAWPQPLQIPAFLA